MSAILRSPRKQSGADEDNPHRRVILLLDMDCFYAQCETVRLGIDQTIPLALVQWRSALAVNYPAREFGIKRGDSFEVIKEKSKGKCVAIHLQVTPVEEATPSEKSLNPAESSPKKKIEVDCTSNKRESSENGTDAVIQSSQREGQSTQLNNDDSEEVDSSQSAYDEEFNQPKEIREEMYRMEKNKMRNPSEGKACLDRYRLASRRIFSLIDETLAENLGRKNFILERASIDELFIDVTAFCYQSRSIEKAVENGDDTKEKESSAAMSFRSRCDADAVQSLKETAVCHEKFVDPSEANDEIGNALRLGCHIAATARRAVREQLGFTLSAGISTSKLVSKLAATYGKPDGQALVYPGAMTQLMEETQIRKARMLGGQLGKKVSSLLPESESTMGSIARMLALDQLAKAIGEESGRWVFDACRGIDYEEVKATLKVLPKSITAFKSFPKISYPELEKWTALLARDVMKRVESDNARNNRLPKSVTVGYTMVPGGAWIGKTFRLPFPTDKDFDSRVQKLVDGTRKALTESGHSSFIRMGFSAIDFVMRPKVGIDSFFNKGKTQSTSTKRLMSGNNDVKKEACAKPNGIGSFFSTSKAPPANPKLTTIPHPKPSGDGNGALKKETTLPESIEKRNSSVEVLQQKMKGKESSESSDKVVAVAKGSCSDALQHGSKITDEELARQLQESFDNDTGKNGNIKVSSSSEKVMDKDKAFALRLQSKFDRENSVLSHVERFSGKRNDANSNTNSRKKGNNKKKSKIDFFLKK